MRRLILLGMTTAAAATATAAQAEGPYVGVQGGVYFQNALSYDFVGLDNFFATKYRKGYDVAGKLGYDFEGIRIDAELGYKRASTDQFGFMISGQPLAVQRGRGVTGNVNVMSAMANVYWDITQSRIRPFIGGGVGVARVSSDKVGYSGAGDAGTFLDKSDVAFAFQLMGGVNATLTRHLSASVSYRYFDVEKYKLSVFNTTASSRIHSSSVLAGLTYSFGQRIADLPRPPEPPMLPPGAGAGPTVAATVAAAPAPEPMQTSFTISFAPASAALSGDARATLDRAATGYREAGHADVMLLGQAPGAEPAVYDEALANRRVAATRAYFGTRGIAGRAIAVQSYDVAKPASAIGTDGGASPTLYISFGPGSGQ